MKKLAIILLIIAGIHNLVKAQFTQLKPKNVYLAGKSVELCFESQSINQKQLPVLTILHSLGFEAINADYKDGQVCFHIPELLTQKAGLLNYKVYQNQKQLFNGALEVIPNKTTPITLEAYCGPKHLPAGHDNFTMITTTVLDSLDNPYPANTKIDYTYGSTNSTVITTTKSKSLYSYEQFVAPKKEGYGRVSARYKAARTQEFRLNFYTHSPRNFSIIVDREHEFADANQLIELSTTKIKDEYNNIIGDGTEVIFIIKNKHKVVAHAIGHTINGSATAVVPAPEKALTWEIMAQIPYFSQSEIISIGFKPSINDFNIKRGRDKVIIEPVTGHMNQIVADGILVNLTLKNGHKTHQYSTSLLKGEAYFIYENLGLAKGTYQMIIEIAGITKTIENIQIP